MEHARSTRLHVGLPSNMWDEAINATIYLINKSPSTPLGSGNREETWTGKKVNYSFLRTFGWILKNRTKLEVMSKKCVFIGYDIDEFGYRLWDFGNHKI